jgi:hypothetical protein
LLSSGAHRKREQPTLESTRNAGIALDVCNNRLPSPIFPCAATVKKLPSDDGVVGSLYLVVGEDIASAAPTGVCHPKPTTNY